MLNDELEEYTENELKQESAKKLFYKKLAIKAGIFCGMLTVFFGILITAAYFGRKSWRTGLRTEIEKVFAQNSFTEYSVGENVKLNSTLAVNCSVYKAESVEKKDFDAYALIIRMPTLYGPVGSVYVYETKKSQTQFIGFAQIKGAINQSVQNAALNSQVKYWGQKIPKIIATADREGKNEKK